ncbi:MAG: hypothetical protein ACTSQJ_08745 [Promethearchaeota archaeon]
MKEERKHYLTLSIIIFAISALLLLKLLPNVIIWNNHSENFLFNLLGLIWPIIGISTAIEFLTGDKWGWGGIMFHFIMLYCMLYYLYLIIIAIYIGAIALLLFNLIICVLGWIGYLYYYD